MDIEYILYIGLLYTHVLIVKFIYIKNIHFFINISIRLFTFNFFPRYSISFCKHSSFPRTKLKWGVGYLKKKHLKYY